jgi:hypothetical protein
MRQLLMIFVCASSFASSATSYAADCNGNGIEDACDLDCGEPFGPCDVSGCGQSTDCNNNGIPDECDVGGLYAGTQGGGGGSGKVFGYRGNGQWAEVSPDPPWDVAAVMSLAYYNGHLYAGVQTSSGYGGGNGDGQVWRYEVGRTWTLVGDHMDNSVMVLAPMSGRLYAGTTLAFPARGRLYECEQCDGTDWIIVGESSGSNPHSYGFRSGIVSSICGIPQLFMGELNTDDFWRYDAASGLVQIDAQPGSCIWDFAELNGRLYAGAW